MRRRVTVRARVVSGECGRLVAAPAGRGVALYWELVWAVAVRTRRGVQRGVRHLATSDDVWMTRRASRYGFVRDVAARALVRRPMIDEDVRVAALAGRLRLGLGRVRCVTVRARVVTERRSVGVARRAGLCRGMRLVARRACVVAGDERAGLRLVTALAGARLLVHGVTARASLHGVADAAMKAELGRRRRLVTARARRGPGGLRLVGSMARPAIFRMHERGDRVLIVVAARARVGRSLLGDDEGVTREASALRRARRRVDPVALRRVAVVAERRGRFDEAAPFGDVTVAARDVRLEVRDVTDAAANLLPGFGHVDRRPNGIVGAAARSDEDQRGDQRER